MLKHGTRLGIALGIVPALLFIKVAQAVSLSLTPTNQTVFLGDTITLEVQISDLGDFTSPSLSGFDLDLSYNAAILSFNNVDFGSFLDTSGLGTFTDVNTDTPGIVNFAEVSFDDASDLNTTQPDNFVLAQLNFTAISTGISSLNLTVNDLGDENTNPLILDQLLGASSISVMQPTTSTPEKGFSLLTLSLTLLGCIFSLHRKS